VTAVRAPLLGLAMVACACTVRPAPGQPTWNRVSADGFNVSLPTECATDPSPFALPEYAASHQREWGLPVQPARASGWMCGGQQIAYAYLRAGGRTEPLRADRKVGGRPATIFHSVRPEGEEVVSVFWPHWPRSIDPAVGLAMHCVARSHPEICRRILDSVRP
jgi:hypothetical protein